MCVLTAFVRRPSVWMLDVSWSGNGDDEERSNKEENEGEFFWYSVCVLICAGG